MRNSGIAKNQHYVPQFLLRHFTSGKKPKVWVFDKQTGKSFLTNIRNVAAEGGFYNFELNGHELTFETSLSEIEHDASRVIKHVVREESIAGITEEEKMLLSQFIALQFVRTKQWREMWESMGQSLAESIRKKGCNPEHIEGYAEPDEAITKLYHMRSISTANEYAPHFFTKAWVLLKATKKHPFFISDNPIALQNMLNHRPYGNIGLAVKGIEIYFPLSKQLTLAMWCSSLINDIRSQYQQYQRLSTLAPELAAARLGDPLFYAQLMAGIDEGRPVPSTQENIINHNSLQVKYAARFVFSSIDEFSLAREMLEKHPNLRGGPKIQVE